MWCRMGNSTLHLFWEESELLFILGYGQSAGQAAIAPTEMQDFPEEIQERDVELLHVF